MAGIEPATSAKAVLNTTKGPIEIELWAKECPLASRNFLQLCLDGYYDGCKFHRVVKDFIVQAGDPSGTGYGGSAIYENGDFADEFHSRLKFDRRGLVGCANAGAKDTNGSQFIITLAATPGLNGRNTLFGRVVGETIYNVLTIGSAEVEEDDRPLYPATITSAEVIIPYFTDLRKTEKPQDARPQAYDISMKKEKRKPKVKLQYRDDDEDDEDDDLGPKLKKTKKLPNTIKRDARAQQQQAPQSTTPMDENTAKPPPPEEELLLNKKPPSKKATEEQPLSSIHDQINAMKASIKNKSSTANPDSKPAGKLSALEELRKNYKAQPARGKRAKASREQETLSMIESFKTKLYSAKEDSSPTTTTTDKELNSDDELPSDYEDKPDDALDFLGHQFKEEEKSAPAPDEDLLVTIDPLEEKRLRQQRYSRDDPEGKLNTHK